MNNEEHSNTTEFLRLMDKINYKDFNKLLATIKEKDIGQYVRRLAIERGSIENDEYPSQRAIEILRELTYRFPIGEGEE